MKNFLAYYYSFHPEKIINAEGNYFFEYMGNNYVLQKFTRPIMDADCIYKITEEMIKNNILVHQIIKNNEENILTYINNVAYILLEISINYKAPISLSDICFINNNSVNIECEKILRRDDWIALWETKIDYFEIQINEIGKKYPYLSNFINYYIGLAENAILYIKNASKLDDITITCVSHKRIKVTDTLFYLYNPTNFIYDYRVRDTCEYIKSSFFKGEDALKLVKEYFYYNYLSYKEALLFYGRLLFPTYFFDLYDEIVNDGILEKNIEDIVVLADEYEKFLLDVYIYISNVYNRYIPAVDWIIKRDLN